MATRPASKLNLQELGIPDEIELVDKQARQSIENMIDDTTTASTSTWSSEKITDEIEDKTAVTKTASGNPITFDDGADAPLVKCVTEIQGSQDLHGYDKPWVGGAGKNKLPMVLADIKSTNTGGTWNGNAYTLGGVTFTVQTDSGENVTGIVLNGTSTSGITFNLFNSLAISFSGEYKFIGVSDFRSGRAALTCDFSDSSQVNVYGTTITENKSSNLTHSHIYIWSNNTFSNTTIYPMVMLSTETDPTFTPYSNICPITAYTEGEIEVRGKNLFDGNTINCSASEIQYQEIGVANLKAGTYTISYTLNSTVKGSRNRPYYNKTGGSAVYSDTDIFTKGRGSWTVTIESDGEYTFRWWNQGLSASCQIVDFQLEVGSRATDYEPYTSTTHTTTFQTSVYRGEVDFVGGSEKHDMIAVDLGDLTWRMSESTQGGFISDLTNYKFANNVQAVCSAYNYVGTNQTGTSVLNNGEIGFYYQSGAGITLRQLYIRDTRFSTLSDFESAISGVQFAYELATPTTSSVNPTNLPIKSLSGYNHIESTTGDMEIEYITEGYQRLVDLIEDAVELPAVTSLDDGKVLTVVDGKWVAASLPVGQNIQY